MQYSYSFSDELQQEWRWSERFAAQPEILRYAEHVADRFDLRRDILFDTRVSAAALRRGRAELDRETAAGERFEAPFCIMATGLPVGRAAAGPPRAGRVRGRRSTPATGRQPTVDSPGSAWA